MKKSEMSKSILSNGQSLDKLLLNEDLVEKILSDERSYTKLLSMDNVLEKIISNDKVLNKIISNEGLWEKLLGKQEFFQKLLSNPKAMGKILLDSKATNKILDHNDLIRNLLLDQRALDKIFTDVRILDKLLLDGRSLDRMLSDIRILDRVLLDGRTLDRIMGDVRVLERILAKEQSIEKVITDQRFINKLLAHETALEKVLNDPRVLHFFFSNEKNLQKIMMDQRALNYIAHNEMFWKNFLEDPLRVNKAIERLISNNNIISQLLNRPEMKRRMQFYHLEEKVKRLKYKLPTYIISFPRAGSNFVQNVLSGSSGIPCRSLYAPMSVDPKYVLSFKSHAPSMEYLLDEIQRLLPTFSKPTKLILLKRDPRDIMISFLEFTQFQKNIALNQQDFLQNVSYFYASFIDKTIQRKKNIAPLNILDAFKMHIKNWYEKKPKNIDFLFIKYEDLVNQPESEFGKIFEFLELDCDLDRDFFKEKVSLYSSDSAVKRERGIPQGWKKLKDDYGQLIDKVNHLLKDEIKYWGYST